MRYIPLRFIIIFAVALYVLYSQMQSSLKENHITYTTVSDGSKVGYVDLGLPSGTLWADRNVGASSPEDYGDYFAWGEVKPKSNYCWSTLKYCTDSVGKKFCKYVAYKLNGNVEDNRITLEPQDDAAYVNWGSSWRIPTKDQLEELGNSSYTTWTWTTRNNVSGFEVESKRNGNFIFLPAAGWRIDSLPIRDDGFDGKYWSSSLDDRRCFYAYQLNLEKRFYGRGYYYHYDYAYSYRYYGGSVRPVRSE